MNTKKLLPLKCISVHIKCCRETKAVDHCNDNIAVVVLWYFLYPCWWSPSVIPDSSRCFSMSLSKTFSSEQRSVILHFIRWLEIGHIQGTTQPGHP